MDKELEEKFRIFEREIMQIQQELQAVEAALIDLGKINLGLDEIKDKKDSEILAQIGRGIFVKAKLLSDGLTVDVGDGNFVKKTIPETKDLIEEQVQKLDSMKNELEGELDRINQEITQALLAHKEKENPHDKHSHEGHNH